MFLSTKTVKVVGYQRKYANENGDLDLSGFGCLISWSSSGGFDAFFGVLFVILCIVLCIVAGSKNKKHRGGSPRP